MRQCTELFTQSGLETRKSGLHVHNHIDSVEESLEISGLVYCIQRNVKHYGDISRKS